MAPLTGSSTWLNLNVLLHSICFCFRAVSFSGVWERAQIYEALHRLLEAWCPVTVDVSELLFVFFLTIITLAQFAQSYWKGMDISIFIFFTTHRMFCALVKPWACFYFNLYLDRAIRCKRMSMYMLHGDGIHADGFGLFDCSTGWGDVQRNVKLWLQIRQCKQNMSHQKCFKRKEMHSALLFHLKDTLLVL